jgi:hypothetical protein
MLVVTYTVHLCDYCFAESEIKNRILGIRMRQRLCFHRLTLLVASVRDMNFKENFLLHHLRLVIDL